MDGIPFYYDDYEDDDFYVNQPNQDYEDEAGNKMQPDAMDYISVWNHCVIPSVYQIGIHLMNMIVINGLYRVLVQIGE